MLFSQIVIETAFIKLASEMINSCLGVANVRDDVFQLEQASILNINDNR